MARAPAVGNDRRRLDVSFVVPFVLLILSNAPSRAIVAAGSHKKNRPEAVHSESGRARQMANTWFPIFVVILRVKIHLDLAVDGL